MSVDRPAVSNINQRRTVAVVGGGINGIMAAWALQTRGFAVELYERDSLVSATSSASTKLLHGGLRYLEQLEFRLVRESLHERTWWIDHAPELAKPLELILPVYKTGPRPRWLIGFGLTLYDLFAGKRNLGRHHWRSNPQIRELYPALRSTDLRGAYSFYDAQMDDYALGIWAARQIETQGVHIHEHTPVLKIAEDGSLTTRNGTNRYDAVVNVAGPWARQLLDQSGIPADHDLDLVRGSHLKLRGTLPAGFFLQVPDESRIVFALPYQGHILLGTTEIEQSLDDPIECSPEEEAYLLKVYNHYFSDQKGPADVIGRFAGLRPLLRSRKPATKATREYAIERRGRVVSVFGGKWTTARVLGEKVARVVAEI